MKTRTITLSELHRDPKNARKHNPRNIGMITKSIEDVGVGRSGVVDENGIILAGNGTFEALADRGISVVHEIETDGHEWVVVKRQGLSEEQKRKLALADNRASDVATWDGELLKAQGVDLQPYFTPGELKEWGVTTTQNQLLNDPGPQNDQAEELRKKWDVKVGQIWQLGEHKIACGDCTDPTIVGALMGQEKAKTFATDPPYGVNYVKTKAGIPRIGYASLDTDYSDIQADELQNEKLQQFLESCFSLWKTFLDNAAWYLWHAYLTQGFFAAAAAAADVLLHRQIIWVKSGFNLTRSGMYHWAHEPCFFGWQRGKQPPWYGEKNQRSVWEIDRHQGKGIVPTEKPPEIWYPSIMNHAQPEEICAESFSGSGSQLIACEQLGRRCRAVEIEPKYVAVVVQRWTDMTGKEPKLL